MATARGAPLAAAVRMVDWIHRHAAIVRHAPHPALAAGLADRNVHVIGIGGCTDGRHAPAMHKALLGGIETQDGVFARSTDDLRISSGRARDLSALAELDLDVVDHGTDRKIP